MAAAACGSDDFAAPAESLPESQAASTATPGAVVFRVIPVTPAPTVTPTPPPSNDPVFQQPQRQFPAELDPERNGSPLPQEAVIGIWLSYLNDARVRVDSLRVDVHLCRDGTMLAASEDSAIRSGEWSLRRSQGRWYEVTLSRRSSNSRDTGLVLLSRSEGRTVAIAQDPVPVFVTDSDVCRK
jgi:hypothetical protein